MTSEKLRSPSVCFGTWLSSGSETVAELAAQCGLDWLLLDMEHGCLTEAGLLANLRAISGHKVAAIVRVPTHEAGLIGRALDLGADGIMAPHVESAEQARALVQAMSYPPEGKRGYSRSVRAYSYGLTDPGMRGRPLLFVQIESAEGIRNVEEIAGVAGVDVLFVGPADLKLSLSIEPSAPGFDGALDAVIQAAKTHGIHAGILIRNRDETAPLVSRGFLKIAVDSDLSILRTGFSSVRPKG
jgi:2-keto-3-deoxy-L-rhamnonate aldolase RhmA